MLVSLGPTRWFELNRAQEGLDLVPPAPPWEGKAVRSPRSLEHSWMCRQEREHLFWMTLDLVNDPLLPH